MALAALLGRQGRSVVVLERYTGLYNLPRAAAFDDETMRTFQKLGVAEKMLRGTNVQRGYVWVNGDDEVLLDIEFDNPGRCGWPAQYMMYQPHLESVLDELITSLPTVEIRRGMTVESVDQQDGGDVVVRATDVEGGEHLVRARYVVGCDGGNGIVRQFAGGELDDYGFFENWLVCDFQLNRDDEVGQLAEALDDYAERLTEVVQRDREFNADVSHELRTPLAVIRGAVELLLSRPELDDKTRTRLLRIQRAEQQCTDLISALLLLSRNERGHGATDVGKLAEQLLDAHRAQLGGKPLELRIEGERGLVVDAPEAAVAVALGNLVGNAVKYTTQGEVVVWLGGRAVEVIDSGPGLSEEDAAKLFERGYRGTHAGHSQGGGIGLSIVRRLCDLYRWDVRVRPGEQRGVVATLTFETRPPVPKPEPKPKPKPGA